MPAWMAGGAAGPAAPGSGSGAEAAPPQAPRTVEEALAIIEQFSKSKEKKR